MGKVGNLNFLSADTACFRCIPFLGPCGSQTLDDYDKQGVTTTAVADVALGLTGAMVSYSHADTLDEEAGSRLRRGDEVLLRVRKSYSVRGIRPYDVCTH